VLLHRLSVKEIKKKIYQKIDQAVITISTLNLGSNPSSAPTPSGARRDHGFEMAPPTKLKNY
jgi:hypothetical protein